MLLVRYSLYNHNILIRVEIETIVDLEGIQHSEKTLEDILTFIWKKVQ